MDSIVSAALEEICSQGDKGLSLQTLWPKLNSSLSSHGLHLCAAVKRAIWSNLLNVAGLKLESRGVSYDSNEPSIQSVDESEKLNLMIIAPESLRKNFVGIYDVTASDSGLSQVQLRVLERLATVRENGITQSELAKELGMKGNNIFYVLRNLECRGLIVRQSTIVRTKEACGEGGSRNNSIVKTNMIHLHRYAKHLGCQQRLEITKEMGNENAEGIAEACDDSAEGISKEDVLVKDFLPALKAICDKLEKADGKVLVVADIKRDLGYRRSTGHRAWRNISNRLKEARVVEEFCAEVNKKEVICLRLLKTFSPKHFEPKTVGSKHDDLDGEELVKLGKRGQITDQLVEVPVEHQIFDMIDAAGPEGLTITEVCRRLGINNKQYYDRLRRMFEKFGMHIQAESHNRGVAYRVWTSKNFNPEASNILPSKPENFSDKIGVHNLYVGDQDFTKKSAQTTLELDVSTWGDDVRDSGKTENRAVEPELSIVPLANEPPVASASNKAVEPELSHDLLPDERPILGASTMSNVAPLESSPSAVSKPPRPQTYPRYPCLTTQDSALREQRILQSLQEEKFLIRAELHRQLESLEKDKHTVMDRKTLDRILNKLQQEGHCRCIRVSVPVVTNCGRSRITDVVLHPSVQNVSPEIVGQIHDRFRSFEMEVRGQGSSRLKKGQSIPVLHDIPRIIRSVKLDVQAERSEAMRANGFVLAKMVRTKLLHCFLWGYLSSSPGWHDLKNPHSTYKLFDVDAAIKAMPLELFLQVVGSTQKFEDMLEKCRTGLCLSDLSEEEYRRLMDTQATGRLSWIIDILRRLKLIRLVSDGHSEDVAEARHTILRRALELKPYIEEPVILVAPSSSTTFLDLRPQIRHDFILSSRKAVDEYWNTLEYCYAAADSKTALHAFPGSAVHEVFHLRSWVSVRVMTADQRAQLLKRVVNDDPSKKLSFKECEKVAKDLNLTLEQVLRVYYDKRKQRLTRFQGVLNAEGDEFQPLKSRPPRKRKRSLKGRSLKHLKMDSIDEHSGEQFSEEQNLFVTSLEDHEADHMESIEEPRLSREAGEHHSLIHKCALSSLKTREKKFSWSEKAERQLVIEYVRRRAALGVKFHRIDWGSLRDLPAPPNACKRRMALLNRNKKFRKAALGLCNMLSKRYAEHLNKSQDKVLNPDNCTVMVRDSFYGEHCSKNISSSAEHGEELSYKEQWDDFEDASIRVALDEVLRYKQMAKMEASKQGRSVLDEWSDLHMDAEGHEGALVSSAVPSEEVLNHGGKNKVSSRQSSSRRLPRKYVKLLNEGISVGRQVYKSLAISNASELFKLVFLSTSNAPEVPNLLAETLRRYSEHDLFAAFNHLREKKIMAGGIGSKPFVLSQQFLQSISSSPFPTNTGKRAARFASWLREREKDLLEEALDLTADLQCGDIFHLWALVSSGELSISPCLPDEGVGEADDSRISKRKSDNIESASGTEAKKMKSSVAGEGEITSRREKGFPRIILSVSRLTISRTDALDLLKDGDTRAGSIPLGEHDQVVVTPDPNIGSINSSHSDHGKEINISGNRSAESPWEAMKSYAEHVISSSSHREWASLFYPELFKTVYLAIQKAGDQGLSTVEVSKVINMQGGEMAEFIIEVLETFGRVLKVNAYDSVHVVDSLYRSKYFLTSITGSKLASPINSKGIIDDGHTGIQPENLDVTSSPKEINTIASDVHKVTILNFPEEVSQVSDEIQSGNELEGSVQAKLISVEGDREVDDFEFHSGDSCFCRPILPWINGDGTTNTIVFRGLVRRVFGILMQNPGISKDDIIRRMDVLNPQSCRRLLELMILDNHIIVRKMHQTTSAEPPSLLSSLLGSRLRKSKLICRDHLFANPMRTALL